MQLRRSALLVVLVLLAAGCRSSGPAISPITASNPADAWEALVAVRDATPALESSARIRFFDGTRRRSFPATLATGEGRMALTAFTPIGSAAFGFFAEDGSVVFLDHVHNAYWRGTFADLAERLQLPAQDVAAGDLGRLLVGLPAGGEARACADGTPGCVENELARYEVSNGGLLRAELRGATIAYEGAFPPSRVVLEGADGRRLEIDHHEVRRADAAPGTPETKGYRCCLDPRIDPGGE